MSVKGQTMSSIRCADCGRWLTPDESPLPCPRCGSPSRKFFDRDQAVSDDKAEVARVLANRHFQAEEGLLRVFRLAGNPETETRPMEPIKLLEVNANTVPSGVLPVRFGPAPASGIPYPFVIVEVSPEEFGKIQTHALSLPPGWTLGEELPRPAVNAGSP